MKRFQLLTILAVLAVLVCCILPTRAEAATEGYYTYTVSNGKATITDCKTSISGAITIPSKLGGYPVTSIDDQAFSYCGRLTSIAIPDSVISIGDWAFEGCDNLTSVTIDNGVRSIGDMAFYGCSNLINVIIGNSVVSVGSGAFLDCNNIEYNIHDNAKYLGNSTNPYLVLISGTTTEIDTCAIHDNTKIIGSAAFEGSSLDNISIPDGVTSIGNWAFFNCYGLKNITIPSSVASVGEGAFSGCGLTGIWVDENNKNYCNDAYGVLHNKNKTILVQAPGNIAGQYTILDSVTMIGDAAFQNCSKMTGIVIGDGVRSIGTWAFYGCSSLSKVTIPDNVTSVGDWAFCECRSLTDVIIGDGITRIDYCMFQSCSALVSIAIPESVKYIGMSAFCECSNLIYITIPDSVIGIESNAFWGCSSLNGITIPNSVTSIGECAFYECNSLNHIAYTGTQEQWNKMAIDMGNETLIEVENIHCETEFAYVDHCRETSVYCLDCEVYITRAEWSAENPNPRNSHDFINATCSTPKTCKICASTEGNPLGHSGGIWFELLEPTCTVDGIKARICSVCNETETVLVAALGHSYQSVVTAPTCTEQGYTTTTCSGCGDTTITDYLPAKGHGWSAWVQINASTCTTQGMQMRFCNCGTRENAPVQKLPHRYANDVCSVCGDVAQYDWTLTEDTAVNRTLAQDLYIDLNGFDLSGTIVTNGFKVYGVDNTTDDYTCDRIGYFSCVDENGNFIVPEWIYTEGEKQYMAICTEDRYSFHRFFVGTTHMSLSPETAGLGYKAAIFGDEMVFGQLAATKAFSFKLQLEGYNPVYRRFDSSELTSGESIALRIRNYDVENYSEHTLYAQVSLTLNDGTVIEAEQVSLTFRWLTEHVNANYTNYTSEQLASFKAMLQAFDIVKKWSIPNLI